MDKLLNNTKGFLGVLEAIMSEREHEVAKKMGEETYEYLIKKAEEYNLNVSQLMYSTGLIFAVVLDLFINDTNEREE